MFDTLQSWKMTETEKVVALIKEIGCGRLGNWDGCVCSGFEIRDVTVDISCGKGTPQAIRVYSRSMDYSGDAHFRPIADEVRRQIIEQSNRGGDWPIFFGPWKKD